MQNPNYAHGKDHHLWKGGRVLLKDGKGKKYIGIFQPDHPRAKARQYVKEEILLAEAALGKTLPEKAVVHHVNGDSQNNWRTNLVVCENDAYHHTIERRTRAFLGCGHAGWRRCVHCRQWDSPERLYISPKGGVWHRNCYNKYRNEYNKTQKTKRRVL